jgi:GAF domain-containing protein
VLNGSPRERERGRQGAWVPSAPRVALLAALSEAFTRRGGTTCSAAVRDSARALADALDDAVVVYEVSSDRRWMCALATHHPEQGARDALAGLDDLLMRADEGFTAAALDTGETQAVPRVSPDEVQALQPELAPIWEQLGAVGLLLAPIAVRGRCLALLVQCRLRESPPLGDDDRRFLDDVAALLALGMASWPATSPQWHCSGRDVRRA